MTATDATEPSDAGLGQGSASDSRQPSRDDVLGAARSLAPLLNERALEGERLRTTPPDVVEAIADAGLFTLLLPSGLGGAPCDPLTLIEVVETVSHADGSAGWSTMIGNSSAFLAWYDPEVARQVLATSRYPAVTSVFAPRGLAVRSAPDEYRISGRWAFNSGCPHCDWFIAAVVMSEDGEPEKPELDLSNVRYALFPATEGKIVETWDAAGLQGTGSHDVVVDDVVVPASHMVMPFHEPARHDEPQCQLPFWTVVMVLMAGFPLGVAQRALDELRDITRRKARTHQGSLADDPIVQVDVARASAALDAARTFVHSAVGDAWEAVQRDGHVTIERRARVSAATLNGMATAVQVVDTVFGHAGGSVLYFSNPLQRCFRDVHAGAQHISFGLEAWKSVGRSLLDVPQLELRI